MQTVGQQLRTRGAAPRKVVVVNGNPDVLECSKARSTEVGTTCCLPTPVEHAYSLIKREQPDLVVLSVNIEAARRIPAALDAQARSGDAATFRS